MGTIHHSNVSETVVSFTSRPIEPRGNRPNTHSIGGLVGPKTSLDVLQKKIMSCSCREWNLGYPSRYTKQAI